MGAAVYPDSYIYRLAPSNLTTGATAVTASPAPATLHDFGGFPAALYALQYPAPGSPALAAEIVRLLVAAGWKARLDSERGLDHGAWVPLLHLAPAADIPVVQVSMPIALVTAGDAYRARRLEGGITLRRAGDGQLPVRNTAHHSSLTQGRHTA